VKAALRDGPFTVAITGKPAFLFDLNTELERDLLRAELISFPLALVVLLWVFRTVVAALLPIVVGGLAVLAGVGAVLALSHHLDMAQYTLNVVSLIGSAWPSTTRCSSSAAFAPSSRAAPAWRQRSNAPWTPPVGRSRSPGSRVAAGLSGLLFYRGSFLAAMGLGGAIVVGFAVLFALTLLPVILGWLGRRVDVGPRPIPAFGLRAGLWHRLAGWVMAHPLQVLVPTLALVAFLGWPFVRLQTAGTDITALPESTESRQGAAALARAFPEQSATRILVAVEFPGDPFTPDRVGALYDATRRWARLPGAVGVESIVNLDPSVTRAAVPPARQRSAGVPSTRVRARRGGLPARERCRRAGAHPGTALQQRGAPAGEVAPPGPRGGDGRVLVGGQTASDVDSSAFVFGRAWLAVGLVVLVTLVALFILLGSVVLPLEAVVMNFLSLAASFGALVWIFQEGICAGCSTSSPDRSSRRSRSFSSASSSGSRWTTRSSCSRGCATSGAGRTTIAPRSPRVWRRPGASSPARRRSWSPCSPPSPWRRSWWSRRWGWAWRLRLRSMPPW
jgi:RND superfamily putative drug exporter